MPSGEGGSGGFPESSFGAAIKARIPRMKKISQVPLCSRASMSNLLTGAPTLAVASRSADFYGLSAMSPVSACREGTCASSTSGIRRQNAQATPRYKRTDNAMWIMSSGNENGSEVFRTKRYAEERPGKAASTASQRGNIGALYATDASKRKPAAWNREPAWKCAVM